MNETTKVRGWLKLAGVRRATVDRLLAMTEKFHPCVVSTSRSHHVGLLFLRNERVVVLLTHINEMADLRRSWKTYSNRFAPEANILILPRKEVKAIQMQSPKRPRRVR